MTAEPVLCHQKQDALQDMINKAGLEPEQVLYMGDDVLDLSLQLLVRRKPSTAGTDDSGFSNAIQDLLGFWSHVGEISVEVKRG